MSFELMERKRKLANKSGRQKANPSPPRLCVRINTMVTEMPERIVTRGSLSPEKSRICLYLNYSDKSMVVPPSNTSENKKRYEAFMKMIKPEYETRKILTQKITLTSKAPLKILELLESSTNNGYVDDVLISECCKYLKRRGKELDNETNKAAFNHYFDMMRNLSRNLTVSLSSRTKLTELIELRHRNWMTTEEHDAWYSAKQTSNDTVIDTVKSSENNNQSKAPVNMIRKNGTNGSKKIVYDREFLLQCANFEMSKVQSNVIELVTKKIPDIARKEKQTRANPTESIVI